MGLKILGPCEVLAALLTRGLNELEYYKKAPHDQVTNKTWGSRELVSN